MRKSLFQKTLFCFLALSISISLAACSQEKETLTAPLSADGTISTEENPAESWDITGKIEVFSAGKESGQLTKYGESSLLEIESQEDLAPYRDLFPDLDDAKLKSILEDTGGRLIFMEAVQPRNNYSYSCDLICRYGNVIEICLTQAENEEASRHQFYLFYFSSDVYNLEDIRVLFA